MYVPCKGFNQLMLDIVQDLHLTQTEILTVTALTEKIKQVFVRTFNSFSVVGEISNFKSHSTGHWYFSLKDEGATIACICFKGVNSSIKFKLEDGMKVVIKGHLDIYAPRGSYSLISTSIEPVGIGSWQLAFDQLKNELAELGLLDLSRKRPIPLFPKKVGIVTSPTGAALHDMLTALARRNQSVSIVIAPSRVQGEGCEEEIAQAIHNLHKIDGVEVILVCRGGGSIEDLWAFNTKTVALAVASSEIPVISGVGHETDITICDLVADLRAPTPTAAAEMVAANINELTDKLDNLNYRLINKMTTKIDSFKRALARFEPANIINNLNNRLNHEKTRLNLIANKLNARLDFVLNNKLQKTIIYDNKLNDLNPLNILKRGYAVIYDENNNIIARSKDLKLGQKLTLNLDGGKVLVEVKEIILD